MAQLIHVKSALADNRVALSEMHPAHPVNAEGINEVFVYGDETFEVARTNLVAQRLASGALVEVDAPKARRGADKPATEPDPTPEARKEAGIPDGDETAADGADKPAKKSGK